jgi:hypothetical protein
MNMTALLIIAAFLVGVVVGAGVLLVITFAGMGTRFK